MFCALAWSQTSPLRLQQLNHKAWSMADGEPGEIDAIAQTPDGTLWLGGTVGLFRFDGVRFVRYEELRLTHLS